MLGSRGAKKAAQAQEEASRAGIAEQARQYDLARSDQAPFMETGVAANARLRALLGLDGGEGELTRRFTDADLQSDPVYKSGLEFGLNEGRGGINARAIAGGGYDSGATLKALTRWGNDYGSTKAEGAYNRFNADNTNVYNRLAGVSGAGQAATNAVQTAGTNAANNTSELLTGAGNARAAGIVGGANAWAGALGGVANAAQGYQSNKILEELLRRRNNTPWMTGYQNPSLSYSEQ